MATKTKAKSKGKLPSLDARMRACVYTRHLMLQPVNAGEAKIVVDEILAQPDWTWESIVRQAIKRKWTRKLHTKDAVALVFAELESRGYAVKTVARLSRPLYA